MAAKATFALKPGVWFRRGLLLIVSPEFAGLYSPLSGRRSTYRPVRISGTTSHLDMTALEDGVDLDVELLPAGVAFVKADAGCFALHLANALLFPTMRTNWTVRPNTGLNPCIGR